MLLLLDDCEHDLMALYIPTMHGNTMRILMGLFLNTHTNNTLKPVTAHHLRAILRKYAQLIQRMFD